MSSRTVRRTRTTSGGSAGPARFRGWRAWLRSRTRARLPLPRVARRPSSWSPPRLLRGRRTVPPRPYRRLRRAIDLGEREDGRPLLTDAVREPRELLVAGDVDELELRRGEPAREERRSPPERHGRDAGEDLVQQALIRELPDQVTAADEPDVPAAGFGHLLVHRRHLALDEANVRSRNRWELPVGEHPARRVPVVAAPLVRLLEQVVVLEHPLVGRRPHRHRAHIGEERFERMLAVSLAVDFEEPVERVVLVGDEPVERRRGVVLRLRHAGHSASPPAAAVSGASRFV